jgi:hypothetical protein
MTKKRTIWLVLLLTVLFVCVLVCLNANTIIDYLCSQDQTLAVLDAGEQRTIIITGESCWEINRTLHYEVKVNGKVASSKWLFDFDQGGRHQYSLIYAENKTLVGVLDSDILPTYPQIIIDFKKNVSSWPKNLYIYDDYSSRLKSENPDAIKDPDWIK